MIISFFQQHLLTGGTTSLPCPTLVDGLKGGKITLRRQDETGAVVYGYSSELTFTGADSAEIKAWLVDDVNAFTNWYDINLTDECCGRVYQFILKSGNIDWCEQDCSVRATLTEYNPSTIAYDCIKSTMIYDNTTIFNPAANEFFQDYKHPRFTYCVELRPRFIHDLLIIMGFILVLILQILSPLILTVSLIITAVCSVISGLNAVISSLNGVLSWLGWSTLGFSMSCPPQLQNNGLISQYQQMIQLLESKVIGCGMKHPAPLVRSYISNVCNKCGIGWQSSIFKNTSYPPSFPSTSPGNTNNYYNTAFLFAPVKNGIPVTDTTTYWIDENKPILSGSMLLDKLKIVFNADYKIINGVLYFERKDWFKNTTPWLQTQSIPHENIIKQCYTWQSEPKPAYGDFQYSKDAVDWIGNEAADRMNDIVEWNFPPSAFQKDSKEVILPFSPVRFRHDGITPDLIDDYSWLTWITGLISGYNKALLLNEGKTFTEKLIIWDSYSGYDSYAKSAFGQSFINANQQYNYPLWFDGNHTNNLYDRFHAIDNPRDPNYISLGFDVTLEIISTCQLILDANIDYPIEIVYGNSTPPVIKKVNVSEIEIDYDKQIMTLKGKV